MMLMAKLQAVAVGTAAVVAAGTVAVTAVQQVQPVQAGAGKNDTGAKDGAANVILRQKEIPISVRDAKGLAVTRRSDNEVECAVAGSAFAGFSAILATQRQEAEAATASAEKAEIVAVFAGEQMPVKSQAAQLTWALYANNTNAVEEGTGIRIQRRQEGTEERFNLTDLTPREVQCIGAVDTNRSGLPAFLQGLWNASAAPAESEATKAAKVKLVDVQRLLREEKLGESIAAFEALRDQAEGLPGRTARRVRERGQGAVGSPAHRD
jgi:hypothetical protein